jgi:hypothetical protein
VSEPAIERFLAAVAARLPGPARMRGEILAELRDGLLEAADAHSNLTRDEAVLLAVREFGDPLALVSSFVPELAAARARRTVLALLAASPVVIALWMSAASVINERSSAVLLERIATRLPGALLVLATVACVAWMLAASGRASRWFALPPGGSLRGAAAIGGLSAVADLAALLLLTARLIGYHGTLHLIALAAAIAASTTRLRVASRASRACLACRSGRAGRVY